MFYTGTERTHLKQLGNGQWISLENESLARQMIKWTLTSYLEHRLRHLFFVSFPLESQCLMFHTYFYKCKWRITPGTENVSVAGQMVSRQINIPEYCSLIRGHHGSHSFLIKCNSLAEPSWLEWRLTVNEIQIYSQSLFLYELHRKSLLLWDKFWNYLRVTPPPTQPWHLEVAWGTGD